MPFTIDPDTLGHLLTLTGIDTSRWGHEGSSSVGKLAEEIYDGESQLQIGSWGVRRVVQTVKFLIFNKRGFKLWESHQTLSNGQRKERNHEPGGKIRGEEGRAKAAIRELQEEFGLSPDQYELGESLGMETKTEPSKTFPGLPCIYEVHTLTIKPNDGALPEGDFSRTDEEDGKTIFFTWVPADKQQ